MRLKGKVALVTGAGSGFGAGIARRFAEEGAKLVVNDLNAEGGARIAKEVGGEFVQGVRVKVRVPEVVVLRHFNGFPRRTVAFSRRNLYRRDNFTCQYCGSQPGTELLSIDHVVPRSRGGRSTWENCVLACLDCNKRKASRTLDEAGLVLDRKPFRPAGGPAFEISLGTRRASWERFVSERYWNVELEA